MARYVLHAGGVVLSVCEASSAWVAANAPTADLVNNTVNVAEGWLRSGPGAYTPPPKFPSNNAAKRFHKDAINAERDARIAKGTVMVNGVWFKVDSGTLLQLLTLVVLGASLPARKWRSLEGTKVDVTQAFVAAFSTASAARDKAIFNAAEDARDAMLLNPMAYDISTAVWPAEYTGDVDD